MKTIYKVTSGRLDCEQYFSTLAKAKAYLNWLEDNYSLKQKGVTSYPVTGKIVFSREYEKGLFIQVKRIDINEWKL
mgnify:CR=1 FL=1|tara:strand:+ start:15068 stop:15295 length:228 start_codon:yes stop_codon:yes gene_type:complete